NTAPDGTVTIRTQTDAGTTKVVHPDGSTESITKGPDPRFGMAAPVIKSDVITTPSGCNDPVILCSGIIPPRGNNHEHHNGRRNQALDGPAQVGTGSGHYPGQGHHRRGQPSV